jgi:preprotein translocase subunit SecG
VAYRVARWFILKPKIQFWANFGRSCNGRRCCVLWPFGIFYGQLVNSMVIWYILLSYGIFFLVLGILYQEKSGNPGGKLSGTSARCLSSAAFRCVLVRVTRLSDFSNVYFGQFFLISEVSLILGYFFNRVHICRLFRY